MTMPTDLFKDALAQMVEQVRQAVPAGEDTYDLLRNVVEEECRHPNAAWRDVSEPIVFCPRCGMEGPPNAPLPPGRAARDLSIWPSGAIEGALMKALCRELARLEPGIERARRTRKTQLFHTLANRLGWVGDTRLEALTLVRDWLLNSGRPT